MNVFKQASFCCCPIIVACWRHFDIIETNFFLAHDHLLPIPFSSAIFCSYVVNTSSRRRRKGGTGTPVHTRHKHSVEYDEGTREEVKKRNKRREAPCFLFIFLSFYWLMYNNYFNHISTNCKTVLFRYTLVVQYRAPTAITRYRCYRYRILPVTLY